ELAPQDARLGAEVAEERPLTDSGFSRNLLDGGAVESLVGEQAQGDQLELTPAGAGRPAAPCAGRGHRLAGQHLPASQEDGAGRVHSEESCLMSQGDVNMRNIFVTV